MRTAPGGVPPCDVVPATDRLSDMLELRCKVLYRKLWSRPQDSGLC